MPEINLSNEAGRDASVSIEHIARTETVRWLDEQGRQASGIRVLKAPIQKSVEFLTREFGDLDGVAEALIQGDPEIDYESAGRYLAETSRVYVNEQKNLVHRIQAFEIVRNPDGTERQRRPKMITDANISSEYPLRWSGVFIKKEEAIRKFVISSKLQLHHINGLTYDFLFSMAQELEKRNSLMVVGGGKKSNEPLILRRAGLPKRGFLEGRTRGKDYMLILHLSNLELKMPEKSEDDKADDKKTGGEK